MRWMQVVFLLAIAATIAQAQPPELRLPVDEVVLPGTAAAIKADRPIGYGPKNVRLVEAWSKNPAAKGRNIRLGIFDTGCDVKHPWLKDRIKGTYNAITKRLDVSDGNNHGTHVAGIVAEAVPDVEIFIIKVLSDEGSGSVVDIAHGLDYAVENFQIDVANFSLGGPSADRYIPAAFERAEAAGVIIICAAGNEGPGENTDGYPARYRQSISTAASDIQNRVAQFSSRGQSVYAKVPGVQIISSLPNARQGAMSGTSMAAPLKAALGAAWCATTSTPKKDRPAAFRAALRLACDHPDQRRNDEGYGLPDAVKLIAAVDPPTPPGPGPGPIGISISLEDLTPAKRAALVAAGVRSLNLSATIDPAQAKPAPGLSRKDARRYADVLDDVAQGKTPLIAIGHDGPRGFVRVDDAPESYRPGTLHVCWLAGKVITSRDVTHEVNRGTSSTGDGGGQLSPGVVISSPSSPASNWGTSTRIIPGLVLPGQCVNCR